MITEIILDTNVLVSAFSSPDGAPRAILQKLLLGEVKALVSQPLYAEYCDVIQREDFLSRCVLNATEVQSLFDAFIDTTQWIHLYFSWRPNLRDEGDNHLLELAVAAGNADLITYNLRDFNHSELRFPHINILTPSQWLAKHRSS